MNSMNRPLTLTKGCLPSFLYSFSIKTRKCRELFPFTELTRQEDDKMVKVTVIRMQHVNWRLEEIEEEIFEYYEDEDLNEFAKKVNENSI
jgi:hypothetical protein